MTGRLITTLSIVLVVGAGLMLPRAPAASRSVVTEAALRRVEEAASAQ